MSTLPGYDTLRLEAEQSRQSGWTVFTPKSYCPVYPQVHNPTSDI